MRRKLLLLLAVMATVVSMAADVTPQQALQEAQRFVQERAKVSGRRVAATPQLTLVSRVSDLYVFNAADNGGFVIVSNDDCVETVLGYSDTGAFDPNNIPDNMRGWLQGYADEIAWAKTHNIQKSAGSAPRRTSTVKTAIAPLIQTRWNQGAPYNNQVSTTVYFPIEGAVTGCVATAMAQVMYYTATKASVTTSSTLAEMPSYTTGYSGITIPAIPAGTNIEWSKMRNTYSSDDTDDGATAVATLMRCCGVSVQMTYRDSYNGGSSASNSSIPNALHTYFGYHTTTQILDRSDYSYADWIDILYHELSNDRPILYGGQSTGGGHAFVCDGYQSEDYFHINWGWGSDSDGNFKLTALNPYNQGIGGSTTKGGFNFANDAVIGLQLSDGTGTVSDLVTSAKKTPNLNVTSFSFSPTSGNVQTGEEVTCTINVTNNSDTNDFDGDIVLHETSTNKWLNGKNIILSKGESKTVEIKFIPTEARTYSLEIIDGTGRSTNSGTQDYVVTSGASNNVDLTLSISAENAELASESTYNLYGNFFKPTVRMTNSTDTDYSGTLYWQILESTFFGSFSLESVSVNVPKNSSVDVILTEQFLDASKNYELYTSYKKNNAKTSETYTSFDLQPAIMTYAADGTITVTKPSGTTLDVSSSTALAIDVTGTGITSITPNSEPNAVYIYSGIKPSGLDGKIVVEKNGSTYTAGNITITDGSGFYSPVDFTATSVEFTYNNDRWADGTNGWNTIMLPFDVTSVTANGTEINWFRSDEDTGKQFWLKEFTRDGANTVDFDHTDAMKANTPYIIALPGDQWGSKWDLRGKTIKFIGENTIVHKGGTLSTVTGSNYRFIGNTVRDNTENIYTINTTGNLFELNASGGCAPFRAFFKPGSFDRAVTSLGIGSGTNTTGIENAVKSEELKDKSYYNLNGQRVAQPTKGLYIVNGKKVIVK